MDICWLAVTEENTYTGGSNQNFKFLNRLCTFKHTHKTTQVGESGTIAIFKMMFVHDVALYLTLLLQLQKLYSTEEVGRTFVNDKLEEFGENLSCAG
jgi:hypothetical protein